MPVMWSESLRHVLCTQSTTLVKLALQSCALAVRMVAEPCWLEAAGSLSLLVAGGMVEGEVACYNPYLFIFLISLSKIWSSLKFIYNENFVWGHFIHVVAGDLILCVVVDKILLFTSSADLLDKEKQRYISENVNQLE
jgi:hypothetical protein